MQRIFLYPSPKLLLVLCCFLSGHFAYAQIMPSDSSGFSGNVLQGLPPSGNSPIADTLVPARTFLPRSLDSLVYGISSRRLYRELYHLIIRNQSDSLRSRSTITHNHVIAYDGLIIRKIRIKRVNVFARSVFDTTGFSDNWFGRTGDMLHRDTRKSIIEHSLLLHAGDPLDVFLALDNERIMRELPYILDARFLVSRVPGSNDSVDLVLLTQDLWPVGFDAAIENPGTGNASVWNQNVLGFGHQFDGSLFWDAQQQDPWGYKLRYSIPNLFERFVKAEASYMNNWNMSGYDVSIAREFTTLRFKYAGAMQFTSLKTIRDIPLPDTVLSRISDSHLHGDIWFGRLFSLKRTFNSTNRSSFFLNGRLEMEEHSDGQTGLAGSLYALQDKTRFLIGTGFLRQLFLKDELIYTFGRTEEVPIGYQVEMITGFEKGTDDSRLYIGGSFSCGRYFSRFGYAHAEMGAGTYFKSGRTEQSFFLARLTSFTSLFGNNRFKFRSFYTVTYLAGFNRPEGEFTSLENNGGISGLRGEPLRGNQKFVINLETVLFSPYYVLGFRSALFAGIDFGVITRNKSTGYENAVYSGIGIGVRLRNEKLVFNTLELKLSYYPVVPASGRAKYLQAGTVQKLRLNDFFPDKPQVGDFR